MNILQKRFKCDVCGRLRYESFLRPQITIKGLYWFCRERQMCFAIWQMKNENLRSLVGKSQERYLSNKNKKIK